MIEKMAVFAPMPRDSDITATAVTIGLARSARKARRRSCMRAAGPDRDILDCAAPARRKRGRPPGRSEAQPAPTAATAESDDRAATSGNRRKMSAAARKKISDAQKKRWAKVKSSKS
jgi:hypothetical protein